MGRSRRRAEVDLALTEEKSGLGWVGKRPKGDVDFCLELEGTSVMEEGEIVHRHGSRAQQGVNKGQGGSFQAIGPVSTLACLPLDPCTRSEGQGAA